MGGAQESVRRGMERMQQEDEAAERTAKLKDAVIQAVRDALDHPSDDWWWDLDGAIHALDGTPSCNQHGGAAHD